MGKLFRKMFFLIPVGIAGNIAFSLAFTDRVIFSSVMRFSPLYFLIALFMSVVPWFTGSLRLFIWGRFLGMDIRYRSLLDIAINAELGAAVSPPLVGGVPVKIWMLMQRGFSGGTALSLTVLESFEDAVFFLVMVPVALTVSAAWDLPGVRNVLAGLEHTPFAAILGGMGAIIMAGVLLARRRAAAIKNRFPILIKITDHIKSSYHQFIETYRSVFKNGKTVFALTMILTTVQWICRYSIISLLLLGLGISPRPLLFMALQVIVFVLMALIPTPGGVGGAEAVFLLIYGSFLPPDTISIVTAGWRFFTFYFLLFLASGLILLFKMRQSTKPAISGGINDAVRS